MKKIFMFLTILFLIPFFVSCVNHTPPVKNDPIEVILKIDAGDAKTINIREDSINKSMKIHNPEGKISMLSFILKDKAFMKVFSTLSVSDVTKLWNDFTVLENKTNIREVHMFINSPGGDAFSGLALADTIDRAKKRGFKITAYASGIIASAAVPVFASANVRLAAPGTIFMVHEASLWKWPGRETASDIRSQNELMYLLRERYLSKLAKTTNLTFKQWENLEGKTTWFSAEKAKQWGLADRIE